MANSSYRQSGIKKYIDTESSDIPRDERCDDYYKLWWNTFKDVLKDWTFEDIKSFDQIEKLIDRGAS